MHLYSCFTRYSRLVVIANAIWACQLAAPAVAQTWTESGDAGETIAAAQLTIGTGTLARINGTLSSGTDTDLYAILIYDSAEFSASTVGQSGLDTQLFLFDAAGRAVTTNDDASAGVPQSSITGLYVPEPAVYYLAISMWDRDPLDANGYEIWQDYPRETERPPDGSGATLPSQWSSWFQSGGSYGITLTGAAMARGTAGATWTESGDAADVLPGQATGSGTLAQINGSLASSDVDLYRIQITNPAQFVATTTSLASFDTQLFLFDRNGFGIAHNDEAASGLRSTLTGQFLPGPGVYYLAVSRFDRDPWGVHGKMWNNVPYQIERAPDGPSYPNRVASWSGTSGTGSYGVRVHGATRAPACNATITSQPARLLHARPGQGATTSIAVSGTSDIQWFHGSTPIPGATGTTLSLSNVTYADAGAYWALVCGSLRSRSTWLDVYKVHPRVRDYSCQRYIDDWADGFLESPGDLNGNRIPDEMEAHPTTPYTVAINWAWPPTPAQLTQLLTYPGLVHHRTYCIAPITVVRGMTRVIAEQILNEPTDPNDPNNPGYDGALDQAIASLAIMGTTRKLDDLSLQAMQVISSGAYMGSTIAEQRPQLTGAGITVAVLDTGVDDKTGPGVTHDSIAAAVDFADYIAQPTPNAVPGLGIVCPDPVGAPPPAVPRTNPDDLSGHGTHVASLILGKRLQAGAAVIRGVAPEASLIDIKVLDDTGFGFEETVLDALEDINNGCFGSVNIINMSLRIESPSRDDLDGRGPISQAINALAANGVIVVAAAGDVAADGLFPPATADSAIVVTAVDPNASAVRTDDFYAGYVCGPRGDLASVGCNDLLPHVAAPGVNVLGARWDTSNQSQVISGTSMAAAHVSGLVALLMSAGGSLNAETARLALQTTADTLGHTTADPNWVAPVLPALDTGCTVNPWNACWGAGEVNGFDAINYLAAPFDNADFAGAQANLGRNSALSISPTPVVVGEEALLVGRVINTGNIVIPANKLLAHVRVGFFTGSNPTWDYHADATNDEDIDPGEVVEIVHKYLPTFAPVEWHTHRCWQMLLLEVGETKLPDDRLAQQNFDLTSSPVYFFVSNEVSAGPITITFAPVFETQGSQWQIQFTPPSVTLAPTDPPVLVEALPVPPLNLPAGAQETIYVESRNGAQVLGAIEIQATKEDCNDNGVDDWFDIRDGVSTDANRDKTPDECQCVGDATGDNRRDQDDLDVILFYFGTSQPPGTNGDIDRDGDVDQDDMDLLLFSFGEPCP